MYVPTVFPLSFFLFAIVCIGAVLMIKLFVDISNFRSELRKKDEEISTLRKVLFELKHKFESHANENLGGQNGNSPASESSQANQISQAAVKVENTTVQKIFGETKKVKTPYSQKNIGEIENSPAQKNTAVNVIFDTKNNSQNAKEILQKPVKKKQNFINKILVFAGALALMFAGFFLIKYSVERGLLSPQMRIVCGAIFAVILGTSSAILLKKSMNKNLPNSLMGAAIAVAFANIFAANCFYGIISSTLAFSGVIGVFVFALFVSKFYTKWFLPFALFGVMLAPIIIKSDNPSLVALLSYVFVATLVAVAVSKKFKDFSSGILTVIATCFWGTFAVYLSKTHMEYCVVFAYLGLNFALATWYARDICKNFPDSKNSKSEKFISSRKVLARLFSIIEVLVILVLSEILAEKADFYKVGIAFASVVLAYSFFDKSWKWLSLVLPLIIMGQAECFVSGVELSLLYIAYAFVIFATIPFRKDSFRLAIIALIFSYASWEYNSIVAIYVLPVAVLAFLGTCKFWKNANEKTLATLCLCAFVAIYRDLINSIGSNGVVLATTLIECAILFYFYAQKSFKFLFIAISFLGILKILVDAGIGLAIFGIDSSSTAHFENAVCLAPFALALCFIYKRGLQDKLSECVEIFAKLGLVATLVHFANCLLSAAYTHLVDAVICAVVAVCAIAFVSQKFGEKTLVKIFSFAFFGFAFVKLFVFSPLIQNAIANKIFVGGIPLFNDFAITYFLPAAFASVVLWKAKNLRNSSRALLCAFGILALFFFANSQIRFCFSSGGFLNGEISSLENYCYSLMCIAFAAAAFLLNRKFANKILYAAFLLFAGMACIKIFFIDSAQLDGILRVLSFAVLGIALLILRYKKVQKVSLKNKE